MMVTPLDVVLGVGEKIIDRVFPDKVKQEAERTAARTAILSLNIDETKAILDVAKTETEGQLEVNQAEAASGSLFVAGWRPFIGWVCGSAFAYKYVLAPVLVAILPLFGVPFALPAIALDEMLPILLGMLGLGAFRTYEKIKGATK
jgi:hypothetical protein